MQWLLPRSVAEHFVEDQTKILVLFVGMALVGLGNDHILKSSMLIITGLLRTKHWKKSTGF